MRFFQETYLECTINHTLYAYESFVRVSNVTGNLQLKNSFFLTFSGMHTRNKICTVFHLGHIWL